jgi:hypothetical protein
MKGLHGYAGQNGTRLAVLGSKLSGMRWKCARRISVSSRREAPNASVTMRTMTGSGPRRGCACSRQRAWFDAQICRHELSH